MADQEPLETTSQDADQLPERIRVHALAKRLGVTSKRILAKLSELGSEARSAQSNVDRAVAETVRDALAAGDAEPATATAAPAPPPQPEPEPEPAAPAQPGLLFSAPDPLQTSAPAPADQPATAQLFTHPVRAEAPAEPVVFQPPAEVAAPLFLPPDASAAEQLRRKRRAERDARKAEAAPEDEADTATTEPEAAEADEQDRGEQDRGEQGADADQGEGDGQPRRRRRGRRGRGRGRGEQQNDTDTDTDGEDTDHADSDTEERESESAQAEESAETTDAAATADAGEGEDTEESEENGGPEGSTRRRRRRRRRKVGGDGDEAQPADDDPPNTVVHEREPRNKARGRASVDEVQGITGSTRLEAKRQRRRDGREAGRRRPPILTESEFLARREAVDRVMVVREKNFPDHPNITQVAVLEDNILVEHFVTDTGQPSMVGNVYLGKVQNVLPSMEAAFVDIGRGRNGVLYAGEVNWEAAGLGGKERKIEQALKPGDQVLVQVSKDPVGHKGARLTTQISLAGRFLVYVPGGTSTGISRKLPDTERKRLKEILREIVPPDAGVIIRTASEGVSEAELARDVERLQSTWRSIQEQADKDGGAPKTLYEEPDLLVKVIRDLFNEDFSQLVIEGERAWTTVQNYIRTVAPDLLARVSRHENNGVDVFETYRIDEQLAKALDRKVWLPSGGTLVIDRTEAMTVIDVNTGKFTGSGGSNLEETVTRNNLEAAEEIVRQMRLRDIGGMIVVDFIDMVLESNRDLVLRRLTEALGRDRTRHQVSEVTSLGLVQMTRKKLGTGLVEAFSTTCEHCHGRGIIVHNYPVEPGQAEESGGRRESGSRRRRGRDKGAAAPAANGAAPTETVEDAAVKRAHPVALAMAAHQSGSGEHDEPEAHPESVGAAEESVADQVADVAAGPDTDAVAQDEDIETVEVRPSRSRRRAGRAQREAARREAAAQQAADRPDTAQPEDAAERAAADEERDETGAATPEALEEQAEAVLTLPTDAGAVAVTESGAEPGVAEQVPVTEEVAAAESAVAELAGQVEPGQVADEAPEPAAATPAPSAESQSSADVPASSAEANGVAPERPARRRRVARSAAAPAADSSAAVFVVSGTEQPAAPVFDADEPAPVVLPRERPRRRAVGRPAGPPADEAN
ncbi:MULTISPECIES: translation initiation factor IF-2 N-terminal domain-containing protein [Nocardia]|uniref:translation initiation factor IF-2 N-terminal domain-containing protein n=1 Tax=Nocardia TaxID=1817 RepID=UPI000BF1FAEE|nr:MULTISPECIES: translation initiation factor IF-2 N-terminal domain-containing protein [Nocardia]MBF6186266.1 translation initiation factor IF-2 N-terminal domain-containing protein [Nocardia farcinica]MBF6313432.1 translation initiation factor IF-2 N-terminal domain-containing protein [Nocardia farcinica]MBF6409097.1 translation initiation factor IF-2 N-terminal domain-containing protein [Nocardia farcinica]PEH79561.1 ribonuclease E [Nocardia sp. FDAARGOS_372]UEX24128.1 translation initiati